jgi:hypothetical protein
MDLVSMTYTNDLTCCLVNVAAFAGVALLGALALWHYHKHHQAVNNSKAGYPKDMESGFRTDSDDKTLSGEILEYM